MRREIFMGITAGATSPSPAVAAIAVNPLSIETTWPAILVQEGNGNGEPDKYKCPYCDAEFDTYEEWVAHLRDEHGEEPPPEDNLWKYVLIGGGIISVSLLVARGMKQ